MFGNVNNLNTFVYPKLFKVFKAILNRRRKNNIVENKLLAFKIEEFKNRIGRVRSRMEKKKIDLPEP